MTPPPTSRSFDRTDLIAGLCVAAVCAAFAWTAAGYGIGTPRRMGPGFFPFMLGLIGVFLGVGIMISAVVSPRHQPQPLRLRRLFFITAAFVLFGVMINDAGLLITILVTTVVGSFADPNSRLRESLGLGLGLALGIWLVFVELLHLGIPVLPGQR